MLRLDTQAQASLVAVREEPTSTSLGRMNADRLRLREQTRSRARTGLIDGRTGVRVDRTVTSRRRSGVLARLGALRTPLGWTD